MRVDVEKLTGEHGKQAKDNADLAAQVGSLRELVDLQQVDREELRELKSEVYRLKDELATKDRGMCSLA